MDNERLLRRQREDHRSWRLRQMGSAFILFAVLLQLLAGVIFVLLLLLKLHHRLHIAWRWVVSPLVTADVISALAYLISTYRLLERTASEPIRQNPLVTQLNNLQSKVCMLVTKLLLIAKLEGWVRSWSLLCLPIAALMLLELLLQCQKVPVEMPNGLRRRPGSVFNFAAIMLLIVFFRLDARVGWTWMATFWPVWVLFALMCVLSVLSLCCGPVAILVAVRSRQWSRGKAWLAVTLCVCLLSCTVFGMLFMVNLTLYLDGNKAISIDEILVPLLVLFCTLLLCFVATMGLLYWLVHGQPRGGSQEEEQHDLQDVLKLMDQHMKPGYLIRESSTLFRRVDIDLASGEAVDKDMVVRTLAAIRIQQLYRKRSALTKDTHLDLSQLSATDTEVPPPSERFCLICCDGPRDTVFLECGHGGVCYACALRCMSKKQRKCPICRQDVTQVVCIVVDDLQKQVGSVVKVQQEERSTKQLPLDIESQTDTDML